MLTFELRRYLITSFLINRYKKTVIVYRSFVIDMIKQSILFPDIYIQDIGNIIN